MDSKLCTGICVAFSIRVTQSIAAKYLRLYRIHVSWVLVGLYSESCTTYSTENIKLISRLQRVNISIYYIDLQPDKI